MHRLLIVALLLGVVPRWLSQTGLADVGVRAFAPQYPLWSDGAEKHRWVSLPGPIDARDPAHWEVPVGTRLWKEFVVAGQKVETRMIWRRDAGDWVFATYRWNTEGTDAELVTDGARVVVGERVYEIPRTDDCKACHEAGPSRVLGFDALQLSDDRDPLAPHAEPLRPEMLTVRGLIDDGLITPAPSGDARIVARSPRERAALGYLRSNCATCHNGSGPLATLGMDLASDAIGTTAGVTGRWLVPGVAPERSRRVAPGHPEASAIVARMRTRWPAGQMPPLGTRVVDEEALALISAWISEDLAHSENDK